LAWSRKRIAKRAPLVEGITKMKSFFRLKMTAKLAKMTKIAKKMLLKLSLRYVPYDDFDA
jgi:hypothetical protein